MKRMKKSTLMMIGAAVFAVLFLFSGVMMYRQYADEKQSADAFNEIAGLVQTEPTATVEPETVEETQSGETEAETEAPAELTAYEKYAAVYEQNSDFVGWISIEGTSIDYPVMQTIDEPNYYLKHAFDKSWGFGNVISGKNAQKEYDYGADGRNSYGIIQREPVHKISPF